MKVEIKPSGEHGKAYVFIGGQQVGGMWLTDRGACYQHTNRDFIIDRDDMQTIVTAMQAAEVIGMGTAQ